MKFLALLLGLLLITAGQQNMLLNAPYQSIAIPSYFYPDPVGCKTSIITCYWTRAIAKYPTTEVMIINPDSGPGTSQNSDYVRQVNDAHAAGVKIIGYVYTNYGNRAISLVTADIDKYYQYYTMDGIFLDEASNDCSQVDYYTALKDYIEAEEDQLVVLNPGTHTPECYRTTGDIFAVFEDSYSNYVNWSPEGWEATDPAQQFWHIVHTTSVDNLPQAVGIADDL